MKKKYIVTIYSHEAALIMNGLFKHIDICSSYSLFYYYNNDHHFRHKHSLHTLNICEGIITAYFVDGSYCTIEKGK